MAQTLPIDLPLFEALNTADGLAWKHPESHVVVYRKPAHLASQGVSGEIPQSRTYVRLATEDVPQGALVITTVSRQPISNEISSASLREAVRYLVKNLPHGVRLLDRAVIGYYPKREFYSNRAPEIFSYDFMSTDGRNVATWLPDMASSHRQINVQMQPGFDGRGRIWKNGSIVGEPSRSIAMELAAAQTEDLAPPGNDVQGYAEGWLKSQEFLQRTGDLAYEIDPAECEKPAGYVLGWNERSELELQLNEIRNRDAAPARNNQSVEELKHNTLKMEVRLDFASGEASFADVRSKYLLDALFQRLYDESLARDGSMPMKRGEWVQQQTSQLAQAQLDLELEFELKMGWRIYELDSYDVVLHDAAHVSMSQLDEKLAIRYENLTGLVPFDHGVDLDPDPSWAMPLRQR